MAPKVLKKMILSLTYSLLELSLELTYNANTSFDETVYILPIPSENFEDIDKGFQVLKEMIFDMTLYPEDIDAERGVVAEEIELLWEHNGE